MTASKLSVVEDDEVPAMTEEQIRQHEPDLLAGLLSALQDRSTATDVATVERLDPKTKKKVALFSFRVRVLSEDDFEKCRDDSSDVNMVKGVGGVKIKVVTGTRVSELRSRIIYTATVEEDRAKLWDDRSVQRRGDIQAHEGWEVIDKILLPGEKIRFQRKIEELAGYNEDPEEAAGN